MGQASHVSVSVRRASMRLPAGRTAGAGTDGPCQGEVTPPGPGAEGQLRLARAGQFDGGLDAGERDERGLVNRADLIQAAGHEE